MISRDKQVIVVDVRRVIEELFPDNPNALAFLQNLEGEQEQQDR
jgi:hypothetical protein